MATNDFQTFATGAGANVVSPATWLTTTARFTGFQSGTASSALANTALRQANFVTTMIAQFIADTLAQNVADNGNLGTLETQFINAIQLSVGTPPQAAFWHFGHDVGPVNVMQVAASPIITAVTDGMMLATFPNFSNTVTVPTLSVNGLSAAAIVHGDGTALNVGDVAVNTAIVFIYDAGAAHWRIVSQAAIPQSALSHFGADVGTANAMVVSTVTPPIAAVTTGMQFIIKKGAATNTTATTLSIAGTTTALTWGDGTAFTGNEWPANADGQVVYEGNFKLISAPTPPSRAATSNLQTFTTSGTYTPTVGKRSAFIIAIGGGGSAGCAGSVNNAGGGWAGGTSIAYLPLGGITTVTVTIGAGGAQQNTATVNGNAGGTTSFGSYAVATGGPGGWGPAGVLPSVPGIGTTGTLLLAGNAGQLPTGGNQGGLGGGSFFGGGGSAGSTLGNSPTAGIYGGGGGPGVAPGSGASPGMAGGGGIVFILELT